MRSGQHAVHARLGLGHWWHFGTKSFFAALVQKYLPPGASVLDAGCGVGDMLGLLAARGYRVAGVDFSAEAVGFCVQRGLAGVTRGDVAALPFADGSFDAALALDVLYHQAIADERAVLGELRRVLRPGGWLFLQLPAYEWLRSAHDETAMTRRRYTAPEVRSLLAQGGFRVVRAGYRVSLLLPAAIARRRWGRAGGSDLADVHPVANAALKAIIGLENRVALHVDLPCGLSVIGVGRKE